MSQKQGFRRFYCRSGNCAGEHWGGGGVGGVYVVSDWRGGRWDRTVGTGGEVLYFLFRGPKSGFWGVEWVGLDMSR